MGDKDPDAKAKKYRKCKCRQCVNKRIKRNDEYHNSQKSVQEMSVA